MHPPPALRPLDRFNALPAADARAALHAVCGSGRWVDAMLARRPFADAASLLAAGEREWFALAPGDWLEAFAHHPRIGERKLDQPRFAATASQSAREQSGMAAADHATRGEFVRLNAEYERRFGHVFLICAAGKSASFMLDQLRTRLTNDAASELRNAGEQQALIVRLRLERMLSP